MARVRGGHRQKQLLGSSGPSIIAAVPPKKKVILRISVTKCAFEREEEPSVFVVVFQKCFGQTSKAKNQ
jgi:hypothetical protein